MMDGFEADAMHRRAHSSRAGAGGLAVKAQVNHAQLQHDHAEHVGEELEGLEHEQGDEDL
jgi:hypothetical protein